MRLIILLVVALTLMASLAVAQDNSYYRIYCSAGSKIVLESFPDSTQGLDSYDNALEPYAWGSSDRGLTIYKRNGYYGWDGTSGYYVRDARAPLAPGQSAVYEEIYLWAGTAVSMSNFQITLDQCQMTPGLSLSLDLLSVPTGVIYNGPTHWDAINRPIIMPFYANDDPTKGYRFRATITAVPEPSSLSALGGLVVSAVGFTIRRKRS